MDTLTISEFIVPVRIGCEAHERAEPQPIRIDLVIETDFEEVLRTGDLARGIDYCAIRSSVKTITSSTDFALLEEMGNRIVTSIMEDPKVISVEVQVQKLKRWNDAIPGITMMRRKN